MKTYCVAQTTSTMDLARQLIAERGLAEPFVAMCRTQTAGRGRGGSVWSQAGTIEGSSELQTQAICEKTNFAQGVRWAQTFPPCTFVIPGHLLKIPMSWISLAVGCAVVDALWRARNRIINRLDFNRCLPAEPAAEMKLKWPNDVWAWPLQRDGKNVNFLPKKIAGVLCESSFRGDALQFVSVGLGLNISQSPDHITHAGNVIEMWGAVCSQIPPDMNGILNEIVAEEIERELIDYLFTERTAEQLMHLTMERSIPVGTQLAVNKGQQQGAFLGLSSEGGLLLQGYREPILAADVTFLESSARLCLDFGNSQIHWMLTFGSRQEFGHTNWASFDRRTQSDPHLFSKTQLAQNILGALEGAMRIEIVWSAVASAAQSTKIVHSIESLLLEKIQGAREILLKPILAERVLLVAGLQDEYAPQQMGTDRALQAWAAWKKACELHTSVAVISVGTALTGLVLDPRGRISESFILPGPAMALNALQEKTARLPKVALPQHLPNVAYREEGPLTTSSSLLRGVSLQLRGIVEFIVRQWNVGHVVLTGGGASACTDLLDSEMQAITSVQPQLVLSAMSDFVDGQKNDRFSRVSEDAQIEEGLPEKVLQSMLRARVSRRRAHRVVLERRYFRRLGGRLEHAGIGLRIDRHLGEKFKFHNRDVWQQRVDIGEVLVEQNSPKNRTADEPPENLLTVKSTYVLKQGDQLWLFHPPEYEPDVISHVDVVHDDGDAAVFCKPGNLVVHAAGLYGKNTFIEIAKKMGYANAAPVHRIDRETSGLLVCARTTSLRRNLSLSFAESTVKKMYLAVTKGTRSLPAEFQVALPIGPAVGSRIRLKLWHNTREGVDALTFFAKLSQWEDYNLYACFPQTGRTNQIRIHLAAIGHWIVGDKMYHPEEEAFLQFYDEGFVPAVAEKVLFPRHWLHNTAIQFLSHPESSLGREPVIAPLTEDLLSFSPTIELLQRAQLPLLAQDQKPAFAELFKKLLAVDFTSRPFVDPQVGADEG